MNRFSNIGDYLLNSLIAAILVIGLVRTAPAQEASAGGDSFLLEEIVVTAERRETPLQKTPIAATAIMGEKLADKAIINFVDLQFAAPGLTINDDLATKTVNIRGIGLASGAPGTTNGVATYVDGVFQPAIAGWGSYYDIENVEILRGPQGTFVGSNSTGGAIFVNTKSPQLGSIEGYAKLGFGEYSSKQFEGAINVPLADIFAIRLAANYSYHDSYYNDIGIYHNEPGKLDEKSGRIGARFQNGLLDAVLKYDHTERETGGYALQPRGTLSSGKDKWTVDFNYPTLHDEKADQTTMELKFTLPGDIMLRTVSGYQYKRFENQSDLDATPVVSDHRNQQIGSKLHTEEINLISPTDRVIDWVLGLYYEKSDEDFGFQSGILLNAVNEWTRRGVFGQIGYDLTPSLKANFGLRYSDYDFSNHLTIDLAAAPVRIADQTGSYEDSEPTGKVGLEWTVNPDNLLYGFVARGFKSGGSANETSNFKPENVMDYEVGWKSTMLDGHLRTQLGLFWMDYKDFQQDILDATTGNGSLTNIDTATVKGFEINAQGRFGGFGFDLGYSYLDTAIGAADFVDTRKLTPNVDTFPMCELVENGIPDVTCTDYTGAGALASIEGGPMLYAPENTLNIGIEYTFNLTTDLNLRPRINYSYIDKQWDYLGFDPAWDLLGERKLLNFQLTLNANTWSMEAYANNLADELFITGLEDTTEVHGTPRVIGFRATYNF